MLLRTIIWLPCSVCQGKIGVRKYIDAQLQNCAMTICRTASRIRHSPENLTKRQVSRFACYKLLRLAKMIQLRTDSAKAICASLHSSAGKTQEACATRSARRFILASLAAASLCLSVQDATCQVTPAAVVLPAQEGLRRQEERTKEQQQQLTPKADVLHPSTAVTALTPLPVESPCFVITEIDFSGKDAWRFRWLQDTAQVFVNRCVGVKGLSQIASVLDAKLIELGYATTRVSLPQQNLRAGKLTLILNVGRVSEINMVSASEHTPE